MARPFIFDMETSDPDDMMALCFLTSHPAVDLKAVTITPGSPAQVAVARRVLELTDHSHVPIGVRTAGFEKRCVSGFHYKVLGDLQDQEADGPGHDILARVFGQFPEATVVTGAALHNLRLMLTEHDDVSVGQWVGQGGFAGDNVVEPEHRLEKFIGRETCATFNFNGDVTGAYLMLTSPQVKKRRLVSKNVCHGLPYDREMHDRMEPFKDASLGLNLLYRAMDIYLTKKPRGKLFHDPLAACCAVEPDCCEYKEVELYRDRGQWGSKIMPGSGTWISVAVNKDRFFEVLTTTTLVEEGAGA